MSPEFYAYKKAFATRTDKILWVVENNIVEKFKKEVLGGSDELPSEKIEEQEKFLLNCVDRMKEAGLYSKKTYSRDATSGLWRIICEVLARQKRLERKG
jgi:hypothetical protein